MTGGEDLSVSSPEAIEGERAPLPTGYRYSSPEANEVTCELCWVKVDQRFTAKHDAWHSIPKEAP